MTTPATQSASASSVYRLLRVTEADSAGVCALYQQREVLAQTFQMPYSSEAHWSALIARSQNADSLSLVALQQDDVVGFAGIFPVFDSPRTHHMRSLGMAVHPAHWGKGVARLLMDALLDYADNWLGLKRIQLTAYSDNQRAIALYQRYGFVVEGTLRSYGLREGVLTDAVTMARIKQWIGASAL